ncbi:hypothetical protein AAE478_001520 [Parahypoxylon ruwenzoriense]
MEIMGTHSTVYTEYWERLATCITQALFFPQSRGVFVDRDYLHLYRRETAYFSVAEIITATRSYDSTAVLSTLCTIATIPNREPQIVALVQVLVEIDEDQDDLRAIEARLAEIISETIYDEVTYATYTTISCATSSGCPRFL